MEAAREAGYRVVHLDLELRFRCVNADDSPGTEAHIVRNVNADESPGTEAHIVRGYQMLVSVTTTWTRWDDPIQYDGAAGDPGVNVLAGNALRSLHVRE